MEHGIRGAVVAVRRLGVPAGVVINKYREGETLIEDFCTEVGVDVLMTLPYSREAEEAYSRGLPLVDELTSREREVLKLIAEGLRNREIAEQLSISEKTVKNHINNIFSKLHFCDRTQATLYAIRQGLVKIE